MLTEGRMQREVVSSLNECSKSETPASRLEKAGMLSHARICAGRQEIVDRVIEKSSVVIFSKLYWHEMEF